MIAFVFVLAYALGREVLDQRTERALVRDTEQYLARVAAGGAA